MLDGYTEHTFAHNGKTKTVYRRGSGPAVIVIHEIPGITPEVKRFADWVADAGFTAFLPHLFGTPGKPASSGYIARQMIGACISREFAVLAAHRPSPITDWLRALARHAHKEIGGKGVGAVGMCLTGNFALTMMLDDCLMAPVLSQPSNPFPIGAERRRALHATPEAIACAKRRIAEEGAKIVGLRFYGDPFVPDERFDTLKREFGDGFEAIEIDPAYGNPHSPAPKPHSVLTNDLIDEDGQPTKEAAKRVIGFFRERLQDAA